MIEIDGTPYAYSGPQQAILDRISRRVHDLRAGGKLTGEVLIRIGKFFRIKNIYHSNAIEGNALDLGETRLVVQKGMTLTGKSLRDQAEAKNLGEAVDFLEDLIPNPEQSDDPRNRPLTEADIRQLHTLVLKGIDDTAAGAYRQVEVQISGSDFPPTAPESIAADMEKFGNWLGAASVVTEDKFASAEGLLAAAVAHTWFVMIHPFIDGNGRVARLLMNLMLMRFGIPIAIIPREDRQRYYDSLEDAQGSDLSGFVALLCECVDESLEEWEEAAEEHKKNLQEMASLGQKMGQKATIKASNEFEIWRSAMDLLKGHMRQSAEIISKEPAASVYIRELGELDKDKYFRLMNKKPAKRTWFFRADFHSGERAARYLFWFGFPLRNTPLEGECGVTLQISRETPEGSHYFEKLEDLGSTGTPNVPDLWEIGYSIKGERFVSRRRDRIYKNQKVEAIVSSFFEDVIQKHFQN